MTAPGPADAAAPALSLRLRHGFPGLTLDVAFEAPAGVTALFGPSGAGKTSVVNAVAGLLRPEQGRIAVGGAVLLDSAARLCLPPHRRRIGYVFQDARLFPHLSVAANLRYGARFAPGPAPQDDFDRVTEMLGIGALLDRRPAALSGGERSRVALGRALLSRPRLLLMDEPLAALDAARKAEILPWIERLRDAAEVPILYVTHSAAELARLATTVVLLDRGRVTRAGPVAEVLSDPDAAQGLGRRDAGAILHATVDRHDDDGLTRLSTAAGTLWLPRVAADPGQRLRVRIEAQDVILSRARPEGLSALNVLPATVSQVRLGEGPGALVQLRLGEEAILARLTRRSVAALGLEPGVACHAVIKSVAVAKGDVGSG
ncbi:molybdenum ABC transporter ATP-binding protein [Frigidibacter sp. ROC022]|uniref:molybdenum ABC transporter ATP-binding protein n=1 Tax=Frigidibacter sp. ROC022 TaxID=2971796 RepID=UPI00215A1B70|nr:molybdenum ABC transporter ATP-binding protein [Frigidibacter sp. ROC022]MCR8722859.1 molybdenum ABC transporter ATP-binding protein [Frigidibacter sp. ROC022]